jgi:predicted DNA-binding transcriptional regulator YafY
VEPYALVYRGGWWYVVGLCHMRHAIRTFRLDRITELSLLPKTFKIPSSFDIQEHLAAEFESEKKVLMRLRFRPDAAQVARDAGVGWEQVEEQADGSVEVTLSMPDLQWAASMTLGFGPIVTVIEPAELRATVHAWATEIAQQYASNSS